MRAQGKLRALRDDEPALGKIRAVERGDEAERLRGSDDHGVRITLGKGEDAGRVVGLHMVYDQIVRRAAGERGGEVGEPLLGEVPVHRVHHGDLLIEDHIGIVRHAVGHVVNTLKKVDLVVVYADVANILRHIHWIFFLSTFAVSFSG